MSLSVNVITVSGFCRQGSDDWIHVLKDMSTAIKCTNYTFYVIILVETYAEVTKIALSLYGFILHNQNYDICI